MEENKLNPMRNNVVFIFFCVSLFCSKINGQEKKMLLTGKVSFVTSQSVYVKFESTKHINIGDTLRFLNQEKPCLLVKNKSSKSIVCISLFTCEIKKGDAVYYNYFAKKEETTIKKPIIQENNTIVKIAKKAQLEIKDIERIRGKISASSYSDLSSESADKHKMLYRFSMNASHINNSKLSFESYLNYRQYIQSKDTASIKRENIFNVYNIALKYDIDSTFSFVVGRKINNKTSSLGAIDGLQAEKIFGKKYVGIIAGFRPDINDYGFNANLFEYGGYIGSVTNNSKFYSQTTLGVLQQNNNGQIDRRYAYFQHSSTIMKKLNLFSSLEFDLYNKVDSVAKNNISLTNLYVSAKYKFSRKFNLMLSYDSRKRIVYYETFQTDLERLLDDNEARQGFRMRMNIKPSNFLFTGFSYSKRFQSSTQNKSDNMNGYLTLSKIPGIGGRLSVNFNKNTSNYLESTVISLRHSRNIINNKLSADFYFRMVDYNYFSSNTTSKQTYYGTNLSLRISKTLKLNVFGELSTSGDQSNNYRINTSIVKRFNNKRKK
ncbi:hypothetical protein [uncultured Lutibacter sp.]|uniref:hypothetical protein n=1 Tax=uncultured Lutibacter sp. TaxID=437739 RepID=UPI002635DB71|nr:hypothetical protein [uncultured Lutibacter sp.]